MCISKSYSLIEYEEWCNREFSHSIAPFFCISMYKTIKYLALKIRSPSISELFMSSKIGGFFMNKNSKCFIKQKNGSYKEITYGELIERRKRYKNYKNKKFIKVEDMLFEVSKAEFDDYHNEDERNKYKFNNERKITTISIEGIASNSAFRENNFIADLVTDIESEIEKRIELQKLNNALLKLSDEEYEIIKKLFYEKLSIRKYAKSIGIPKTTLSRNTKKILKKLKIFLEN